MVEITDTNSEPKTRYVILSRVTLIDKRGSDWYVRFEGSWESLSLGTERPHWEKGDVIKLSFEKR